MNGYPSVSDILALHTRLTELLGALSQFYEWRLQNNPEALDYCTVTRALHPDILKYYRVGLAPAVDVTLEFLESNGFSRDDAFTAGAVMDLFEDRIMFPVQDLAGSVVGFSGRIWQDQQKGMAKYVNSPKNPVYCKSLTLYGLWQALEFIRSEDYVLVVEGNLDVMAMSQAGIGNVVAPCGTALTKHHLVLLKSLTERMLFRFDNDPAGKRAAEKTKLLCKDLRIPYRTFEFKGAKDPDEFIRKRGVEPLLKSIGEALV